MYTYAIDSGIAITCVRVNNFRSLANIEVELGDLTVLIGSNNAGKTSFLDALYAAVGAGRKILGQDDVRLIPGEALAPRERQITIDVLIRPVDDKGIVTSAFPLGSFWTALFGSAIILDADDFSEFVALRTTLGWSVAKADYVVERKPLKEWRKFADWLDAQAQDKQLNASQLEPLALHYIDAKRDLDEDLRKQGSFWRKMTEDLGLDTVDVAEIENILSGINQQIVDKSDILKHLRASLSDLQVVVSADSAGIDIAPVARKLRDLSKGIDVSFSTAGAQSFPLSRHGMGTRSLASLLVFRAFASWKNMHAAKAGDKIHSVLALEEPESHLHPQAQRSLFAHIKAISGQRVVSTHSPYFAGQAQLQDLRLFLKRGGDTSSTKLDLSKLSADDIRKLQDTVIDSRGDLLFARTIVFFEGQTEEQALPIWAQAYWGSSIHELGFSFVRVNGTDYFPFIWLAQNLQIPWYVMADGEAQPLQKLEDSLKKAALPVTGICKNVVVLPAGGNFESQLLAEGYQPEVEAALDILHQCKDYLTGFMDQNDGLPYSKGKGNRDYKSAGGRQRAALDAMKSEKTRLAKPLARVISSVAEAKRRFPQNISKLFSIIGGKHGLKKQGDDTL